MDDSEGNEHQLSGVHFCRLTHGHGTRRQKRRRIVMQGIVTLLQLLLLLRTTLLKNLQQLEASTALIRRPVRADRIVRRSTRLRFRALHSPKRSAACIDAGPAPLAVGQCCSDGEGRGAAVGGEKDSDDRSPSHRACILTQGMEMIHMELEAPWICGRMVQLRTAVMERQCACTDVNGVPI